MKDRPFDITKAVDFSDAQIADTWVDLAKGDGFFHLADPRSTMPLILLGGKGSGRTHLMRYYSYPVQKIRAGTDDLVEQLRKEGYLGIYMRCEGLNAGRFAGKGQSQETWSTVFAYYMDLWLAELTLIVVRDALSQRDELLRSEPLISQRICQLFDETPVLQDMSLAGVVDALILLRRQVDVAVNNAALSRTLGGLRITASRGRLVNGIPRILTEEVPLLKRVQFDYLIDEFENLSESQQEYVNTLIREKTPPCTFIVGARLFGFRTKRTLSAAEENKAGSEYELVLIDEQLRDDPRYEDFARRLIAKRLAQAGYANVSEADANLRRAVDGLFETHQSSRLEEAQLEFVLTKYPISADRPWIAKLRHQLETLSWNAGAGPTAVAIRQVIESVSCFNFPLVEKANIFLLYQDWSAGLDLVKASASIAEASQRFVSAEGSDRHEHVLGHFKVDLFAQILRECRRRQRYAGLQSFIDMSAGLPRHLLILLKYVHRWAVFMGESPFSGKPISFQAQRAGVLQAANWFFDDAKASGAGSGAAHHAVDRLAGLMRQLRFSDKPVESSLTTFSFREPEASAEALEVVRRAHEASLLVRIATGAKDRNDDGVTAKYQLNPMLSPRYDLPLARRGTIALSPIEIEAIFVEGGGAYDLALSDRLARTNAPFRRYQATSQHSLPGFEAQ